MFTYLKALSLGLITATMTSVVPGLAGEIRLETALAGASLHDGGIDMVVYFHDRDDHYEVVATYARNGAPYDPDRLRMALVDGDNVSFGLPGKWNVLYRFARVGDLVSVVAEPAFDDREALLSSD